jgi:hypothetical protein
LGYSKKGWTDGEIGVEWIKDFGKQTAAKADSEYRLLLVDGHNSHYIHGFLAYARTHKILVLCYPSHTTHVYQGLDVVVFSVLKQCWSNARNEYERTTGQSINKKNFLTVYGPAHKKALISEVILTAFRKIGVWSFNPNTVTKDMMAPSRETSCEGSLPTAPPTPVKLIASLLRDLSIKDNSDLTPIEENPDESDSTTPSTPMHDIANIAASNPLQKRIHEAIVKLSTTQITNLLTDKPLSSSLRMPAAVVEPIQTHMIPQTLLAIELKTKNEVVLFGALWEAEERCEAYEQCVITLQAQTVLNEAYCNKLHFQLAFQEEKKKNPGAHGKLIEDGLARLLSRDKFYEKVVEFTKWQKEKEVQKETRRAEREELKAVNADWKKKEAE